jgi:hypothetical protein
MLEDRKNLNKIIQYNLVIYTLSNNCVILNKHCYFLSYHNNILIKVLIIYLNNILGAHFLFLRGVQTVVLGMCVHHCFNKMSCILTQKCQV